MKNSFFLKNHIVNIYEKPSRYSKISSQILYGEEFKILSKSRNWLKIKTSFDNYNGYIKKIVYTNKTVASHKIYKLRSRIFEKKPNRKIKQTKFFLSFASKISIIKKNKTFAEYEKNKWIKISDIKKINHIEKNCFKIFRLFLKIKYIWGGKSCYGLDCSAILQLFYYYNNKFYPRDTKNQIKFSNKKIKHNKFNKGDIIFWKGHVAICLNSKNLIHAYGPRKKVLIMPINYTIKEIEKTAFLKVKKITNIFN